MEDDLVTLLCQNPNPIEFDNAHHEFLISTTEINDWDLSTILTYETIRIQSPRNRLIEQSSYFQGLLSGQFSESCSDYFTIQWNLEHFIYVLKFIYGCPLEITSHNFLPLFEAALYFGVEALLIKCKSWFSEVSLFNGVLPSQIHLVDLIDIWNFSIEHAYHYIQELCVGYLARNFMWALSCNLFCDVPFDLLISSVKHSHLTVDSEKHLSDGLLQWLDANVEQLRCSANSTVDYTDMLKQIRVSLLPLWFAAGKRRCFFFCKHADESIEAIHRLLKRRTLGPVNILMDRDFCHARIRFTKYTKKVDLSGCPQVTLVIFLLSLLPSARDIDPILRKTIEQSLLKLEHIEKNQNTLSRDMLPLLSFEAVQEVDISKCSGLNVEAAIECFSESFPSLRNLKAAYHINLKLGTLSRLVKKCPLVTEVNLTVDTNPVIPSKVTVLSQRTTDVPQRSSKFICKDYIQNTASLNLLEPLLPKITKLTLKGRSDLTDLDLQDISESCVFLSYLNIKACVSVTDTGISALISRCPKLQSLVVCDTSFARNSVLALCSGIANYPSADFVHGRMPMTSLACELQMLHLGGCKGVDEASLLELLSQTHKLKSLCLRETCLVDRALNSCMASSLELLDVSDTMVSGAALAQLIRRNSSMKCFKARGCKHLLNQEINVEGEEIFSSYDPCKELYFELGKMCKLEEIELGWGLTSFSIEALGPAIMSLKAITVGLGGSLGENILRTLPIICPLLECLILYFQVVSDGFLINVLESLKHLQVLALCYCVGFISPFSFKSGFPNLRILKLERVTPWMTNDDLLILTRSCANLIELFLLGCTLLNSDSQQIISHGWPGLISIHLEECGQVTASGVSSLLSCLALEDLLLRHNGAGIPKNFILDAASSMPMLRKISLDVCDAIESDFEIPNYAGRFFLSNVKIARCKFRRRDLELQVLEARKRAVHKETLVTVWNSTSFTTTVVSERL